MSLPDNFFNSSLSLSTSCPAFPIMIPGLAVVIVIVTNLRVLSMITRETLAFARRVKIYFLILSSSAIIFPKSFPPYQLDSHPLIIPSLFPTGLVFCPIIILKFGLSYLGPMSHDLIFF